MASASLPAIIIIWQAWMPASGIRRCHRIERNWPFDIAAVSRSRYLLRVCGIGGMSSTRLRVYMRAQRKRKHCVCACLFMPARAYRIALFNYALKEISPYAGSFPAFAIVAFSLSAASSCASLARQCARRAPKCRGGNEASIAKAQRPRRRDLKHSAWHNARAANCPLVCGTPSRQK